MTMLRCYIVTNHRKQNVILNLVKDLQTLRYAQYDIYRRGKLITTLASHDIKHQLVRFVHALRTDAGKVADTAGHIIVDDTFYRGH